MCLVDGIIFGENILLGENKALLGVELAALILYKNEGPVKYSIEIILLD